MIKYFIIKVLYNDLVFKNKLEQQKCLKLLEKA